MSIDPNEIGDVFPEDDEHDASQIHHEVLKPKPEDSGVGRLEATDSDAIIRQHEHIGLNMQRLAIAQNIHFRPAGHNYSGQSLGMDAEGADAQAISILDGALTISPSTVEEHMKRFHDALLAAEGKYIDVRDHLDTGGKSFFEIGGQARQVTPEELLQVFRDGYGLVIEYLDRDTEGNVNARFPVGYHFGFPSMPEGHKTLSADSVVGEEKHVKKLQSIAPNVYTIWRTGVLNEMTEEVREQLNTIPNIRVPEEMIGTSFQRLSLSALTKYFSGKAAMALSREYVVCNIGKLSPADDSLLDAEPMPNGASLGANQPLFARMKTHRGVRDVIELDGRAVGEVVWDMFGNHPDHLIDAVMKDDGVYKRKGGIPMDRVEAESDVFVEYLRRKAEKKKALNPKDVFPE